MKYYKFVFPLSRKVFGTIPNYLWDEESPLVNYENEEYTNSFLYFHLLKGKEKNVIIPKFKAKSKASKTTNLLCSTTFNDLVIDYKLKKIIENYSSFGMIYYDTFFRTLENKKLPYWLIKPIKEGLEFIDYKNTTFVEKPEEYNSVTWKYYKFNNALEYIDFEKNNKVLLKKENLIVAESCNCDFWGLMNVFNRPVGYIVSEKLREKIEQENLTGISFLDFNTKWP